MNVLKKKKIFLKSSLDFPCSYINGNKERRLYVSFKESKKKKSMITEFTRNGFRRNYDHMYIPVCKNCKLCVSSRINVQDFKLSKSSKRNLNLNKDLVLKNKVVNLNDERFRLFKKYCQVRHKDGQMKKMNLKEFEIFYYNTHNKTKIYDLLDKKNKLYGSILLDILDDGYSAVYSFFNPIYNTRGLGKNLILRIIQELKLKRKTNLYLGYWVSESKKMSYKISFDSVQLFINGQWLNKNIINF
jgi:arginine-tRNA-protein transferase